MSEPTCKRESPSFIKEELPLDKESNEVQYLVDKIASTLQEQRENLSYLRDRLSPALSGEKAVQECIEVEMHASSCLGKRLVEVLNSTKDISNKIKELKQEVRI